MKQINNLKIKNIYGSFYKVVAPDKRILEEFGTFQSAVDFCKRTKDFLKRKKLNIESCQDCKKCGENICGNDTKNLSCFERR